MPARASPDYPRRVGIAVIEAGILREMIEHTLFSVCNDETRFHLNGVLFIDRMTKKVRATLDEAVKTLAKATREAAKPKPSVSP